MSTLLARHVFGPLAALYVQPEGSSRCELHLVPAAFEERICPSRGTIQGRPDIDGLPSKFQPLRADSANSLVQLKLREDDMGGGFGNGITLMESKTMDGLEYAGQEVAEENGLTTVSTRLNGRGGRFHCIHRLTHRAGEAGVRCSVEFVNDSDTALSLELLSSFALNGLTPFHEGNATPHLHLHRFRSWWSLEGRVDSTSLEALHLERSWAGFGTFSERFGQVGSLPVRRWFPTAAVEDRTQGVVWAAQLGWAGSWQMELFRRGDRVTLCGGLADRETGHWIKTVEAGGNFRTPEACLTVVAGSLDDACHALLDGQRAAVADLPGSERDLPPAFNEWCTSWGNPNHENILAIARRLEGSGVRYVVIDDGWAVRPPEAKMQSNGDWIVDETKFPGGLKPTCDALRELGFIPGIWFEFEVINPACSVWNEETHLLQRDGRTLQVGSRRFWNFNDPWVDEYLTRKMIDLLRDNGIGYLKVDYNDSIGLGCDHSDSLGEGLRLQIEGVQRFFKKLRTELPELVIENCSSGGHRLEPSMQALASMGSFSDAHESVIIPLIARNLQRLILPRQSLIWAVLHASDDDARLRYSLAATFLGRVCLSGEIHDLSDPQMDIVREALALYARAAEVIDLGVSTFHGTPEGSYYDPAGWQAVVRRHGDQVLVVAHGYGLGEPITATLSMPEGAWKMAGAFAGSGNTLDGAGELTLGDGCQGGVWLLTNQPPEKAIPGQNI